MNYGRQHASKKREKITSKKTMKRKRMGVRFFKVFLIFCLIGMILGVSAVGVFFKKRHHFAFGFKIKFFALKF